MDQSPSTEDKELVGPEQARQQQVNYEPGRRGPRLACITDMLAICDTPYDCATGVLQLCQSATGADVAVLLDRAGDQGGTTVAAGKSGFGLPAWPEVAGIMARPRIVADVADLMDRAHVPIAALGYRGMLSVPLTRPDGSEMALVLLATPLTAFDDDDLAFMQSVGRLLEQAYARVSPSDLEPRVAAMAPQVSLADLGKAYGRIAVWQGRTVDVTNAILGAQRGFVDAAINEALASTGDLANSDRTYVFRMRAPDRMDNTNEWAAPGIAPMIDRLQDMPLDLLDEWRPRLERGQVVEIPDTQALAPDSAVRDILLMQDIKSLLLVPMLCDGTLAGFVGYDAVRRNRTFLPLEIQLLKSVATAINAVMDRAEAEAEAEEAQAGLQAERDRLKATLAAIPELVLELDVDRRFVSFNSSSQIGMATFFKMAIGRVPDEFVPEAVAVRCHELLATLVVGGPPGEMDFEIDVEGERRSFVATAAPKSRGGVLAGYVVVIRDDTARRRQQRELLLKGKIAELTSNLVTVTDASGCIDWVNPAFERRTGWKLEEVRGKQPGKFLQSMFTNQAMVRRMSEAIDRGKQFQGEILNRSRFGEEYWVSSDIQPLIAENGQIEGFVAVQTDITALHRSHQRALRDRALAMDASMDGIAISDRAGRYSYMNKAHREMFGIRPEDDIHSFVWQDFCPPDVAADFVAQHWAELKAQGTWRGELTGLSRSGELLQNEVSLTMRDYGGLLWIARDISPRVKANLEQTELREQLQLAQRQETIAHVTSGVAHDLTNIVAVVAGTANLLEIQCGTNQDVLTGLARIKRATDIARDLVAGLGSLGRREVKRAEHDLRALTVQGKDLLGTDRSEKYAVKVALPTGNQPVWADPTELLQVLVNLALNACEAGPPGTNSVKIEVLSADAPRPSRLADIGALTQDGQYSCFVVSDTGSGVEPAQKQRMFDRYFTTKGSAGTGLGLPIVAGILGGNDAALWFDSVPGQGSTVTVAWPACSPTPNNVSRSLPGAYSDVDLSGRNILVVDDVADVADILAEMIETSGAVAVAVSDSTEAHLLLSENPGVWSALVTDFHMPGINGAELALLASQLEPPVSTVLVTALPQKAREHAGLFDMILSKPVDAPRLIDAVRIAVSSGINHTKKV